MGQAHGAEQGTPLPEVALHSTEALTAFLRAAPLPFNAFLADGRSLSTADGRAAVSLAMDLIERAGPDPVPALPLLGMAYNPYDPGPFALTVLRVGARVWESGGSKDRPHRPHYAPRGTEWAGRILSNVRGLATATPDPGAYRLATEEGLAVAAIVVRFAVRAAFSDRARPVLKIGRIKDGWGQGEQQTQYSNRRFEELVRTRPADHDRILAYIEARGAPKGNGSLEDLREWLDSETAQPLAGGWL